MKLRIANRLWLMIGWSWGFWGDYSRMGVVYTNLLNASLIEHEHGNGARLIIGPLAITIALVA